MRLKLVEDADEGVIETPALLLVTNTGPNLAVYYVDSDSFTAEGMSPRDKAVLEAFVALACRKLGWSVEE